MAVKSSLQSIKAQIGKIANLLDDEAAPDDNGVGDSNAGPGEYAADRQPRQGSGADGLDGNSTFDHEIDDGHGASFDTFEYDELSSNGDIGDGGAVDLDLDGGDDRNGRSEAEHLGDTNQTPAYAGEGDVGHDETFMSSGAQSDGFATDAQDDDLHVFVDAEDGGWVLPAMVGGDEDDLESSMREDGAGTRDDSIVDVTALEPTAPGLAVDGDDVKQLEIDGATIRDRVVNRLVTLDIVTTDQIRDGLVELERARKQGYHVALWRLLTLLPGVDRERIFAEAASVYRFPHGRVARREALNFIEKIANVFADEDIGRMLELFVIPVGQEVDRRTGEVKWIMATHDPTRPEVHKLLRELNLKRFELYYASESLIGGLITEGFLAKNEYLDRLNDNPLVYDIGANFGPQEELVDNEELEAEINRSSLINLFEATLVEAVNLGASDIHIFPNPDAQIEIHFRVDGHLEMWHREERIHPESFLAVVKDKSKNVDRFEKDTAQDGFIQRHIGDTVIRFRVSILPIASHKPGVNAESIVIRVLDDRKVLTDLRGVGMLESALNRFQQAIHQPHGMIILTGPTGSGKSTTLVAALHQVITSKVNVLTIEDPVEYLIKGVRQVKLSHHLNMEQALRALLRHDPDIVMVGEMRDRDTAELAIKLANTGHLTFSTLHTNDAPSAVSRLFKMGIEPFLIAYAINIVVAQRLIRKLCPTCKVKEQPNEDLLKLLGFSEQEMNETEFVTAGKESDCPTCAGQGFKGRRAVAETLYFSDAVRRQILASGDAIDEEKIRVQAESEGMLSLLDSAKEIAKMGETSVDEMMRITGS